jgi:hypothetical protein
MTTLNTQQYFLWLQDKIVDYSIAKNVIITSAAKLNLRLRHRLRSNLYPTPQQYQELENIDNFCWLEFNKRLLGDILDFLPPTVDDFESESTRAEYGSADDTSSTSDSDSNDNNDTDNDDDDSDDRNSAAGGRGQQVTKREGQKSALAIESPEPSHKKRGRGLTRDSLKSFA